MRTSDFNYDLPAGLIAQTPDEPRDSSRLLVLFRDSGKIEHRIFLKHYSHELVIIVSYSIIRFYYVGKCYFTCNGGEGKCR